MFPWWTGWRDSNAKASCPPEVGSDLWFLSIEGCFCVWERAPSIFQLDCSPEICRSSQNTRDWYCLVWHDGRKREGVLRSLKLPWMSCLISFDVCWFYLSGLSVWECCLACGHLPFWLEILILDYENSIYSQIFYPRWKFLDDSDLIIGKNLSLPAARLLHERKRG